MVMHRFPTPNMEQEANEFAVALLMPGADIRPYFVGKRIDLALLASLKPEWKVSMAALLMRAHKLKFLTDNQNVYLWKQISARGYRLREPAQLDFEPERPELLSQIVRLHFDSLEYTAASLSKLLCVHEREFRDLYQLDDNRPKKPRITIVK
jgi:Zn-dependent peptidase ImmA (M78 family)